MTPQELGSYMRSKDGPHLVIEAIRDHIEPVHLIPDGRPQWEDE